MSTPGGGFVPIGTTGDSVEAPDSRTVLVNSSTNRGTPSVRSTILSRSSDDNTLPSATWLTSCLHSSESRPLSERTL